MVKKEWNKIDLLRHVRHDWLNKLQLIKGNIDLNKIERTKEIIHEIIVEAQNETKLSNLALPHLAILLMSHNWEDEYFQLEFEVIHDMKCQQIDDEWVTNWVSEFFSCLSEGIKQFGDNHLSITIDSQEQGLRFFFDFCGIIEDKGLIEHFLQEYRNGIDIKNIEINKEEMTLEVLISAE